MTFASHLKGQAKTAPVPLAGLYNEALQTADPDATAALPYTSVKYAMRRARQKNYPKNITKPEDVSAFLNLRESHVCHYYHKTILMDVEGKQERMIILFSPELVAQVNRETTTSYLFDATFKTAPKHFYQVLNICADILGNLAPLFCVLMTRKVHPMYVRLFEDIRDSFPQINPQEAMSDFEWGLMSAIHKVFPRADLAGCNYHSGEKLLRKMRDPGIQFKFLEKYLIGLLVSIKRYENKS